ncbi:MAG: hypothetical protein JNL38_18260 [Myxococcales bacterium]|jgi:hypothetical protein|nr:hypothetical protein [Myxococcales bacterium]
MSRLRFASLFVALASSSLAAGCVARVHPATVTVARADVVVAPPPAVVVESHPYVVYEGERTYWVDGRWYRRTSRGWVYYRSEPAVLYRYRASGRLYVRR